MLSNWHTTKKTLMAVLLEMFVVIGNSMLPFQYVPDDIV